MSFKLALSCGFRQQMKDLTRYEVLCLEIDVWWHIFNGRKNSNIDYVALALYQSRMSTKWMGVKQQKKRAIKKNQALTKKRKSKNKQISRHQPKIDSTDEEESTDQDQSQDDDESKDANMNITWLPARDGLKTRFTLHNIQYHSLLDMDKWTNLQFSCCKHLEKSNKNTKFALRKGAIRSSYPNRIMKYYKMLFCCQYLIEGGRVDKNGKPDPYGYRDDQHISHSILSQLTETQIISPFHFMKFNSEKPECCNGSDFKKQLDVSKLPNHGISILGVSWVKDIVMQLYNKFKSKLDGVCNRNVKLSIKHVQLKEQLWIWRRNRRIQIGLGTMVMKSVQRQGVNSIQLLIVEGIGSIQIADRTFKFVIGHHVKIYFDPGNAIYYIDRNMRGEIQKDLEIWEIKDIQSKAYYAHACDSTRACTFDDVKYCRKHQWKNKPIVVIFWWTGIGCEPMGQPLLGHWQSIWFRRC